MEYKEICNGFKNYINIDEKLLTKAFKFIDQGKTGCLEYEEFLRACINKKEFINEENMRSAFELFLKAKLEEEEENGEMKIKEGQEIPIEDFKSILGLSTKFTDEQWKRIINEVDVNGDGKIEFDEFKDMMEKFLKSGVKM